MRRVTEELDLHLATMDKTNLPGFPLFRFSGSQAVAALMRLAQDSDAEIEKTLSDPRIPLAGRPTVAAQQRREAASKVQDWQRKHLPALDAEIAAAIPAPTRPAMSAPFQTAIWQELSSVEDSILDAFYASAPADAARVDRGSRVTAPHLFDRRGGNGRAERSLLDDPLAAILGPWRGVRA